MQVFSRRPPAPLYCYVQSIWHFLGPDIPHEMERIVPSAGMQLLVNLHQNQLRWTEGDTLEDPHRIGGAAICGASSRAIAIDTAQQRAVTGVSFTPGGGAAFFRQPASEFSNKHIDFADIENCRSLRDQLLQAGDAESVYRCWLSFLCSRLQRDPLRPWLSHARELLERNIPVSHVATDVGLSERRFRDEFSAQVGLSPKRYGRLQRLQRLIQDVAQLTDGQHIDWAGLAALYGYYDQAHMNHEFRSFTGISPSAYQPRNSDDWNHLVIA